MSAALSRRATIGALMAVPTAAAAETIATPPTRDFWGEAERAYRDAQSAYLGHLANVSNPLQKELERLCSAPPETWVNVKRPGKATVKLVHRYDMPDAWMNVTDPAIREAAKTLSARHAAWSIEYEAVSRKLRVEEVEAEDCRLYDLYFEAQERLMKTPAPHAAAVLVKLEIMWSDWSACKDRERESKASITGDLKRLAA